MFLFYAHFCAQGRLNEPNDIQGQWGEVKPGWGLNPCAIDMWPTALTVRAWKHPDP